MSASSSYTALFLSPMVPSTDMARTGRFLVEALGFEAVMEDPSYGIYAKDGRTIHTQPAGTNLGEMAIYLEVDNLETVWEQLQGHLDGLRVRAPFVQPYHLREIHVEIPATSVLLFIGQEHRD